MGFLDNFRRRPSPELEKATREIKERLGREGDEVKARIQADTERERTASHAEHAGRMAEIDNRNAAHQAEREKIHAQMHLDTAVNGLHRNVSSALMSALGRSRDMGDPSAAFEILRRNSEEKFSSFKESMSAESVAELEAWAIAEVGGDIKLESKIKEAFNTFRKELEKQGVL